MDNIFEYLPIIVAVLVFLVRLFSKKQPQNPEPTNTPAETGGFEDLLKQITKQINEAKEQQTTTTTQEKSKKIPTIQGDVVGKEKGLTEIERNKDQHFKPYEIKKETKKEKQVTISKYTPESQVKEVFQGEKGLTKQQRANIGKSSAYQIHKKKSSKFANILKNKDTFKNALIVNELLNRKHF
ncbi:hypothetical protein AD998_18370 [bacterium 336/3]|jgi:hypothetical protein|nr:hypothetical protein AD998_18370 [bacterium 336/3]